MKTRTKILLPILGILLGVGAGFLLLWGLNYFGGKAVDDSFSPSYVQKRFLKKNENSRPGTALEDVKNLVIHYVANPGSSALANRNYFNSLADPASNQTGLGASAHFIVGLEGEVIQCIPVTEVAYANYPRNYDTISVEVCHPDESGRFAEATYASLVKLTADLLVFCGLTESDVIRHYDVSGKLCPKYYVEHEDAWETFLADVGRARAEKALEGSK